MIRIMDLAKEYVEHISSNLIVYPGKFDQAIGEVMNETDYVPDSMSRDTFILRISDHIKTHLIFLRVMKQENEKAKSIGNHNHFSVTTTKL